MSRRRGRKDGARRGSDAVRLVGPVGLGALGAMHAAWALGWRWPGGTDEAWAERIAGSTELPTAAQTWMMALVLFGGAAVVTTSTSSSLRTGTARKLLRTASWGGAAVLLARALYFLPQDFAHDRGVFNKLDLAVYAPLSATLGLCIAWSLRRSVRPTAITSVPSAR